ncbi:MAG: hypothetical protein QOH83_1939, partial [Solirubrobacteraceae bacterium]|nr:hypothetical protein [Solirubrobacteraceae bacterium]
MRRYNLSNPTFTYDQDDPSGYRSGRVSLGPELGA